MSPHGEVTDISVIAVLASSAVLSAGRRRHRSVAAAPMAGGGERQLRSTLPLPEEEE